MQGLNKKELEIIRSLAQYRINSLNDYVKEQEKALEYCNKQLEHFPKSKIAKEHYYGVNATLLRYLKEIAILTDLRDKVILMKEVLKNEK